MKLCKIIAVFIVLVLISTGANAQSKTIPSVLKFRTNALRPIYQGTEVKGYIALYFFDKEDKQNNTLVLQIFDENLNEAGEKKISVPKSEAFIASEYDGTTIMLKFADLKTKEYDFRLYNEKGEQKKALKLPVSKGQLAMLNSSANLDDMTPDLFSIDGSGFINYSMEEFKKSGYNITMMNGDGIKWTYSSNKNSDELEYAYYYQSNQDVLLSIVYKKEKLMSTKADATLLGLDIKTGKKLFEVPAGNLKNEVSPVGAYIESTDKIVVFGQYFPKGANVLKDKSLGFSIQEYNGQGKVVKDTYMTWAESVGKFQEVKDNKLKDGGYIFFHKAVKAANGHLVLVGEQFYKAANGAGIAAMALGGRSSGVTKLVIDDFMFLEFDKDYKIVNAKRIDKQKSDFVYPGIDYMGSMLASWIAKSMGAFDYEYTSFASDNSKFNVVYIDVDKLEDSKKKEAYCGSVAYQDGKYTVDKVPFNRGEKATFTRVKAAKNGYFLLVKYFKKAKELKLDLVKFNN